MLRFRCFMFLLALIATVSASSLFSQKSLAQTQDFDGDRVTDVVSWEETTGIWTIRTARSVLTVQWGAPEDIPVPADYNGDGITEIAVWRPFDGNWYISTQNLSWNNRQGTEQIVQWGTRGDIPLPGDYNRERRGVEIAVYRKSTGTCFISTENLSWDKRGEAYIVDKLENCQR